MQNDHPEQATNEQFTSMVDAMILDAHERGDQDLIDGLKWIDAEASKNGVDTYEMTMRILRKHLSEKRAKEWVKTKSK